MSASANDVWGILDTLLGYVNQAPLAFVPMFVVVPILMVWLMKFMRTSYRPALANLSVEQKMQLEELESKMDAEKSSFWMWLPLILTTTFFVPHREWLISLGLLLILVDQVRDLRETEKRQTEIHLPREYVESRRKMKAYSLGLFVFFLASVFFLSFADKKAGPRAADLRQMEK